MAFIIKCNLKLKLNHFRTSKKEIPGYNYWNGEFKCLICKQEVKSFVEKEPKFNGHVLMLIKIENECSGLNGKIRVNGEQRDLIKHEVFCKGKINFKNEAFQKSILINNIFVVNILHFHIFFN